MKRIILMVAVLSTLACSSGTQYERGAYITPVRAPAFDPVTDAPHTTGQPGYVNGQRVERSTNKRYAPASKEPQMMAADGDSQRAVELMFSEPVPDETPDGLKDSEFAKCWRDFQRLLERERDAVLKLSAEEVRCMRHVVLAHCGARQVEARTLAVGKKYDDTFEDFQASRQRRVCGKKDEYHTRRAVDLRNKMMTYGDDVLNWRTLPVGYQH